MTLFGRPAGGADGGTVGAENTASAFGTPVVEPLGVFAFIRGGSGRVFGGEVISLFLPQATIISKIKLKVNFCGRENIIRAFSHRATSVV